MKKNAGLIFNVQKFSLHDGPGIRTTVFLKGCPLRCQWCSNPESQSIEPLRMEGAPDSKLYGIDELLTLCLQDELFYEESGGGVTLSGGEPLFQADFALDLLNAFKARGIHTAVETTGFVKGDVFAAAVERADLLLFDVKHYDSEKHREKTGASPELIHSNLRRAIDLNAELLVRIPVIPGFNAEMEDAEGFARLLSVMGIDRAQLLPFHQMGDRKYALLGMRYAYQSVKPLYRKDLAEYAGIFQLNGIDAFF